MIDLDGTENKARLGANAMLAVSCAVAKAAAEESTLPLYRYLGGAGEMQLPVPLMNVINGGAHANNSVDLQEFMLVPLGAPTFREALRYGAEVFHTLKKIIDARACRRRSATKAASRRTCRRTRRRCSCCSRRSTRPATRRAPTSRSRSTARRREFYKDGGTSSSRKARKLTSRADAPTISRRGATSIRSSASRTAWPSTTGTAGSCLTDRLGKKVQLVGDDLFVTNTKILKQGIAKGVANSILIKINQIGTLTETFAAISMANARRLHGGRSRIARARPRTA